MKKKIVFLIPGLYYGGMERVAFIAQELLKKEYDVTIATLYSSNADYKPDFDYIDLNCPPKKNKILKVLNVLKRTYAVRKMKKRLKPDVVMSFGTTSNFANVFSKINEKTIVGIRSYDWLYNYFISFKVDKITYQKADLVVSVSKVIAKDAERLFNIPGHKSKVLYNPYNIEYIQEKAKESIIELDLQMNDIPIISVGRLVDQKGYNHLIKAFSLVVKKIPDAKLIIVGHGEKELELKNLINVLNLNDRVILLGGQSNPYKFMKIAKLYILSSLTEGFPNAMVEAMALGTPVLAVDCKSGPREILINKELNDQISSLEYHEFGMITIDMSHSCNYDPNFFEDCDLILAESIVTSLSNKNILNKYKNKSLERVESFSYSHFKKELIKIIEGTIR